MGVGDASRCRSVSCDGTRGRHRACCFKCQAISETCCHWVSTYARLPMCLPHAFAGASAPHPSLLLPPLLSSPLLSPSPLLSLLLASRHASTLAKASFCLFPASRAQAAGAGETLRAQRLQPAAGYGWGWGRERLEGGTRGSWGSVVAPVGTVPSPLRWVLPEEVVMGRVGLLAWGWWEEAGRAAGSCCCCPPFA